MLKIRECLLENIYFITCSEQKLVEKLISQLLNLNWSRSFWTHCHYESENVKFHFVLNLIVVSCVNVCCLVSFLIHYGYVNGFCGKKQVFTFKFNSFFSQRTSNKA